jgi:hypothetical protein
MIAAGRLMRLPPFVDVATSLQAFVRTRKMGHLRRTTCPSYGEPDPAGGGLLLGGWEDHLASGAMHPIELRAQIEA